MDIGYSTHKKGIDFNIKIITKDITGEAENFSAVYINDVTKDKAEITGDFIESSDITGTYYSPMVNVPEKGQYTFFINNDNIGLKNYPKPVIIVDATIDDVKVLTESIKEVVDGIADDIKGINSDDLDEIKTTLLTVKNFVNDENSDAVNSVYEFVEKIDTMISKEGGVNDVLDLLNNNTDDVEAILRGDQYLADGTTENPMYGKTNADIFDKLANALDADNTNSLISKTNALKVVLDANKSLLENEDYGLVALKTALDTITEDTKLTDVLNILSDENYGLEALKNILNTRFDSVDSKLEDLSDKIDNVSTGSGDEFTVF